MTGTGITPRERQLATPRTTTRGDRPRRGKAPRRRGSTRAPDDAGDRYHLLPPLSRDDSQDMWRESAEAGAGRTYYVLLHVYAFPPFGHQGRVPGTKRTRTVTSTQPVRVEWRWVGRSVGQSVSQSGQSSGTEGSAGVRNLGQSWSSRRTMLKAREREDGAVDSRHL